MVARSAEIPPGGVKLFRYPTPQDACILVRKPDGRLVAYSQKCTHLSCAVYYSRQTIGWSARVTRGTSRLTPAVCCRVLRRVPFHESMRRSGDQVYATGVDHQAEGA